MFEIARKDMINWHKTYLQTIKKIHGLMQPEHVCPNISVPLCNLRDLEIQIEKVSFQMVYSTPNRRIAVKFLIVYAQISYRSFLCFFEFIPLCYKAAQPFQAFLSPTTFLSTIEAIPYIY